MADEDDIDVRVRLRGGQRFAQEMRQSERAVDRFDRRVERTAKGLGNLRREVGNTRLQLGPFSTRLRYASLGVGYLVLGLRQLAPALVGVAEGAAVAAGGVAGAGVVGLTAYAQAAVTAKLATSGLTEALEGDLEAWAKLSPVQRKFVMDLQAMQPLLDRARRDAAAGLLPGLGRGIQAARGSYPEARALLRPTGRALGGAAEQFGRRVGSVEWGRDITALGGANVRIIENLADAGVDLADALKDVVVEAAPLAVWLSRMAEDGAENVKVWADTKRETGDLADFYAEARVNLESLARSTGNITGGIVNLFGAGDVDGTRTLQNFEQLTQRFEDWTTSPAVRANFADAVAAEIPQAVGAVISSLAENLPDAAATAGAVFWESFWAANTEGKAFIAAITGAKVAGAIRGTTPLTPMFTYQVNAGPDGGLVGGSKAGLLRALGVAGLVGAGAYGTGWLFDQINGTTVPSGPGQGGAVHRATEAARPDRGRSQDAFRRRADPVYEDTTGPGGRRAGRMIRRGGGDAFRRLRISAAPVTLRIGEREVARANINFQRRERARGAKRWLDD
jgi:hypothetical protein